MENTNKTDGKTSTEAVGLKETDIYNKSEEAKDFFRERNCIINLSQDDIYEIISALWEQQRIYDKDFAKNGKKAPNQQPERLRVMFKALLTEMEKSPLQNKRTHKHIPTTEINLSEDGCDKLRHEINKHSAELGYQVSSELLQIVLDYSRLSKKLRECK